MPEKPGAIEVTDAVIDSLEVVQDAHTALLAGMRKLSTETSERTKSDKEEQEARILGDKALAASREEAVNAEIAVRSAADAVMQAQIDALNLEASGAPNGVTAGSYGPNANASPAHGASFSVPFFTVNSLGSITRAGNSSVTLPGVVVDHCSYCTYCSHCSYTTFYCNCYQVCAYCFDCGGACGCEDCANCNCNCYCDCNCRENCR